MRSERKKISFFYRDIGKVAGAVAQRGNYFVDAVIRHPAASGADVHVYCVNYRGRPPKGGASVTGVRSLKTDNKAGFLYRAIDEILIGFSVGVRSQVRRSDLFVISTPPYISGLVIAFFQILFGRAYAIDIRDMYPRAYLDAGLLRQGGSLHRLFMLINRFIFKRAAFIVCATEGQRGEVDELISETATTTIYNGFPGSLLRIDRPQTDGFRVVTHGTLGVYQNVEFILQLAQSLEQDDIEFVVIGQGNKAEMVEKAEATNISFLGELPFEQVITQVAACDVGLCVRDDTPQSRYSFPVKAWEYIGLKMPTLIYPRCEVSDVFPNLDGLKTFDVLDLESFRAAFLDLKAQKNKEAGVLALQDDNTINTYTREELAGKFADLVIHHSGKQ
jgi:glycosyltransferase involved in cell wall biosynthesis